MKIPWRNKIVISSPNVVSYALKKLADKLSEKVGYCVYRVKPERVRGRVPVAFFNGFDKRYQYERFAANNVAAPSFCTRPGDIDNFTSKRVVARTLTNSSEGKGVIVFERRSDDRPRATLYTEYIPKKKEFRVHIWNNEVIDVLEKRKKKGADETNSFVRNTANGYVFCRQNVVEPEGIRELALSAVHALGRTYGGVDVIWNERQNKCYVLEVNSRPGIEGTTVELYANAILKGLRNGR